MVSSTSMKNLNSNLERAGRLLISLSVPYVGSKFFCFILTKSISYMNWLVEKFIEFADNSPLAFRYAISIWELLVCLTKKKISHTIKSYFVLFSSWVLFIVFFTYFLQERVKQLVTFGIFSLRGTIEDVLKKAQPISRNKLFNFYSWFRFS